MPIPCMCVCTYVCMYACAICYGAISECECYTECAQLPPYVCMFVCLINNLLIALSVSTTLDVHSCPLYVLLITLSISYIRMYMHDAYTYICMCERTYIHRYLVWPYKYFMYVCIYSHNTYTYTYIYMHTHLVWAYIII